MIAMDYLYYIFGIFIFLAVVLLIEGTYLAWNTTRGPEAARIARRLRQMGQGGATESKEISIVKERLLSENTLLQRLLALVPNVQNIDRQLQQSGLTWSVSRFCGISILCFVAPFVISVFYHIPFFPCILLALLLAAMPYWYVRRAINKRIWAIEQQLPDALDLMGRALRAGHAFSNAGKMVADEMNDPLASEFRMVFDEVNFGVAVPDALMNMANRVPSTDMRYFVIAVLIQRETGGNLSELLASISAIIRDRIKLLGQVRVLSAEGKLSAWILSCLPFAAGLMIQITNPEFLAVLFTDPAGQKMVLGALMLMAIGILAMRKIIRIRV